MKFAKKIFYENQDYALEILNLSEFCPICKSQREFKVLLKDELTEHIKRMKDVSLDISVFIEYECCKTPIRKPARLWLSEVWITNEIGKTSNGKKYSEEVFRQIILVRKILSDIDGEGQFTQLEPSNELIVKSFIPGYLEAGRIWISDKTSIHPTVRFFPPVLIGKGTKIGENVIIGPNVIMVENTIIKANEEIFSCVLVDSIVVLKFLFP